VIRGQIKRINRGVRLLSCGDKENYVWNWDENGIVFCSLLCACYINELYDFFVEQDY